MREPPNIPVERLRACLREEYNLAAATVAFLPQGHDYLAGVYRVVSEQGEPYLLKVTSRPLYEPSCLVPRYLQDWGIDAVVAPIPATSTALWTRLMDWTVIVYPFLDGDTSRAGMTTAHWQEAGGIFGRIHEVRLAPEDFPALRREAFDPTGYTRWLRAFEAEQLPAQHGEGEAARALRDAWLAHRATIHTVMASLEQLAAVLRARSFPYVLCHADLHPANLLRDRAGRVHVIDWDEVMLAPKERDFIFVWEPYAAAFAEGYGQSAIDWVALTYFRWERVAQDLIEDAQQVCFRDGVGEDAKADAVQGFVTTFAPGSNVDAAYAAAAHLPPDLSVIPFSDRPLNRTACGW